jgi:hypothetical protein
VKYYSSVKKNEIMLSGRYMDGTRDHHVKQSKVQTDGCHVLSLICAREVQRTNACTNRNMIMSANSGIV